MPEPIVTANGLPKQYIYYVITGVKVTTHLGGKPDLVTEPPGSPVAWKLLPRDVSAVASDTQLNVVVHVDYLKLVIDFSWPGPMGNPQTTTTATLLALDAKFTAVR